MPFSESTKLNVKKKANFTCCWCQNRLNKIAVHHIIPESAGGLDIEENAAPLCGSCHDLFGMNPNLRKEIRLRRDHWYEICSTQFELIRDWPIGLDVPLLDFYQELPQEFRDRKGIRFTDKEPTGKNTPPLLYLSVYFTPPIYRPSCPEKCEKWLSLSADMRFAFHLGIKVCAWNNRDVSNVMEFLRGDRNFCDLTEEESVQGINYLGMFRQNGENRLVMSTITPTRASISIRALFSEKLANVFANYLEEVGFSKLGW